MLASAQMEHEAHRTRVNQALNVSPLAGDNALSIMLVAIIAHRDMVQ
jgi:hypothetical protein